MIYDAIMEGYEILLPSTPLALLLSFLPEGYFLVSCVILLSYARHCEQFVGFGNAVFPYLIFCAIEVVDKAETGCFLEQKKSLAFAFLLQV